MDQQAREQAIVSALATEHFVLKAARSAPLSVSGFAVQHLVTASGVRRSVGSCAAG